MKEEEKREEEQRKKREEREEWIRERRAKRGDMDSERHRYRDLLVFTNSLISDILNL